MLPNARSPCPPTIERSGAGTGQILFRAKGPAFCSHKSRLGLYIRGVVVLILTRLSKGLALRDEDGGRPAISLLSFFRLFVVDFFHQPVADD